VTDEQKACPAHEPTGLVTSPDGPTEVQQALCVRCGAFMLAAPADIVPGVLQRLEEDFPDAVHSVGVDGPPIPEDTA
jgi:hypothetical protein